MSDSGSAFIAEAVERELRRQALDEYLADYESRKGPVSEQARQRARQVFDEVFAEEGEWLAASRAAYSDHRAVGGVSGGGGGVSSC